LCFTFFTWRWWRTWNCRGNVSFYDNIHMMGFKLTNRACKWCWILVPETIASHFPDIIHPLEKKI
jgi:hypothetical protein